MLASQDPDPGISDGSEAPIRPPAVSQPVSPADFHPGVSPVGQALEANPLARVFFRASAEPLVVLDAGRRIVAANPPFIGLAGQPLANLLGRRVGEVLSCTRVAEGAACGTTPFCATCGANRSIRQALSGEAETDECRILTQGPDGPGAYDLEVRATPFDHEAAQYVFFTIRDISARKRRAVFERLFFHDLLNVLGGIRGILEVWPDLDEGERLDLWAQARGQMDTLVEEIQAQRELALAERGDLVPRPELLDGAELAREVSAIYRHHEVARDRQIVVSQTNSPAEVTSDRRLLTRVLGNLIKNALEASGPGQVIEVSFVGGTQPKFRVRNEGVMPDTARLQVFQRSFTTKGEPGRGLGTFSAKLLVERYLGGRIVFRSDPGLGTIFEVTLPPAASAEAGERRAA